MSISDTVHAQDDRLFVGSVEKQSWCWEVLLKVRCAGGTV